MEMEKMDMDGKFEVVRKLLMCNRSVRRFDGSRAVDYETLLKLVDLTRYCASGRNAQPLRYRIVDSAEACERLFPLLAWAGYYTDWSGPSETERPVAYLIQCLDTGITANQLCDDGLQLEAITLGATALGLNACIIKAFNAEKLSEVMDLPARYRPLYVVALGYAAEKTRIVEMPANGEFKYYRNAADEQCVPKRSLKELII